MPGGCRALVAKRAAKASDLLAPVCVSCHWVPYSRARVRVESLHEWMLLGVKIHKQSAGHRPCSSRCGVKLVLSLCSPVSFSICT